MKKMKLIVSFALALTLALCILTVGVAEDAVKIGFIGPLTGGAAVYGTSAKQGAEVAVAEINALGGIQLALNPQDDAHDAELSVNAYNTLLDQGAQMIVGCVTSSPCIAVAAEANNDRVFMLTPAASSPKVLEGNDVVYQVCFDDPKLGVDSAKYIGENGLASKVAVIYNNGDPYSTGIYQAFVAEAANQPFEIVSESTFPDDSTTDFSVQVSAAKDAGAEFVFLPIYYTPASNILKQANSMEYDCMFLGVDGMDGILTMEGFDISLAEGVMLMTPFSADALDDKTVNFVTKYREAYGESPTQFAADAYDCVYILYEGIKAMGITAETGWADCCESLRDFMVTYNYDGITGNMTWNEDGAVSKSPKVVTIQNGVYVDR